MTSDIFRLAGASSVIYGLWIERPSLAFIAGGAALLAIGFVTFKAGSNKGIES